MTNATQRSSIDGPTQLLPDFLTLQLENWGGFPNGRRLQDDVDDVALTLFSPGAISSDGVSGSDVPFQTTLPFLAHAH